MMRAAHESIGCVVGTRAPGRSYQHVAIRVASGLDCLGAVDFVDFSAAPIAGLADTHAVAISAASLAVGGRFPAEAALAILAAFTANQVTKLFLAGTLARGRFLALVGGGLALMVAAAWVGRIAGR